MKANVEKQGKQDSPYHFKNHYHHLV